MPFAVAPPHVELVDQDVRGHLIYEIDDGQWNIPELRTLLETIAKDHATVEGYEVDRDFPRVGRRIMLLNARKVFYEKGTHTTTLLAFEDITDRRALSGRCRSYWGKRICCCKRCSTVSQQSSNYRQHPSHQGADVQWRKRDCNWKTRISVLSVAPFNSTGCAGRGGLIEIGSYLSRLCETLAQS